MNETGLFSLFSLKKLTYIWVKMDQENMEEFLNKKTTQVIKYYGITIVETEMSSKRNIVEQAVASNNI